MIVTGALIAESASVVDNKLNIQGGVVSAYRTGTERLARVMLITLIKSEPGETSATVDVSITPPTGEATAAQFPVPESSLGGEVGFITAPLLFEVPDDGRYVISVSSADSSVQLPLNVTG